MLSLPQLARRIQSISNSIGTSRLAKAFEEARTAAELSTKIEVYSARHTFATKVMGETGNLALVMRPWGIPSADGHDLSAFESGKGQAIVNERPTPSPKKSGLVLAWHNPGHNDAA